MTFLSLQDKNKYQPFKIQFLKLYTFKITSMTKYIGITSLSYKVQTFYWETMVIKSVKKSLGFYKKKLPSILGGGYYFIIRLYLK